MNDINMDLLEHLTPHETLTIIKNRAECIDDGLFKNTIDSAIFKRAIDLYLEQHDNIYGLILELID